MNQSELIEKVAQAKLSLNQAAAGPGQQYGPLLDIEVPGHAVEIAASRWDRGCADLRRNGDGYTADTDYERGRWGQIPVATSSVEPHIFHAPAIVLAG